MPMTTSSAAQLTMLVVNLSPGCSGSSTIPITYGTGTSGFHALWLSV